MYYPLLKIHRKSAIFDNKFIENQWNWNQILAKIELFLNQIDLKLTQNLAQIHPKSIKSDTKIWTL